MNIDIPSKKALITGASRGIGKAIAKYFHEVGFYIVGTATQKPEKDLGFVNEWIESDFSCDESLKEFCTSLTEMGGFDVCVNNAGINVIKPLEDINRYDYTRIQKINLEAPYQISRSVANGMRNLGGGKIVNIASIWSSITKRNRTLYSTMKSGILGMTRSLAVELASDNILVNAVSPGFTKTELTSKSLSGEEITTLSKNIPLGRFAEVDEIAAIVTFLSSEKNSYITGQNIIVDGGFTII